MGMHKLLYVGLSVQQSLREAWTSFHSSKAMVHFESKDYDQTVCYPHCFLCHTAHLVWEYCNYTPHKT